MEPNSPSVVPSPTELELAEYVAGRTTAEIEARVTAWMAADPAHAREVALLRAAWERDAGRGAVLGHVDVATAWQAVQARGGGREEDRRAEAFAPRRFPLGKGIVRGRHWLLGGLFGGAFVSTLLLIRGPIVPKSVKHRTTYATSIGQRAAITLADGSRVVLGPASRFTVDIDFGQTKRIVTVIGAAYFDVPHSAGAPFTVHTGPFTTRVLGTQFGVRWYPKERMVRVSVVNGKVATQRARTGQMVVLPSGTIGRITDSTATVTAVSDVAPFVDWAAGRLAFRDTPVPEMLRDIGDWYGYDFRLADSTIAAKRVTVSFTGRTPTEALNAIKTLLNVTFTFSDAVNGRSIVTVHTRTDAKTPVQLQRDIRHTIDHQGEMGR